MLFGSKLIAPKASQDNDGELSSVEAQKAALATLSKQEKLLLLELQRTRQNIVQELNRLDPVLAADSWPELRSTIADYEQKIIATTKDPSGSRRAVEKSKGKGRLALAHSASDPALPGHGHGKSTPSPLLPASSASSAMAKTSITRLRTGVDMLPALTVTGESPLEVGLRKQGPIRLPVFKLPAIDPGRVVAIASGVGGEQFSSGMDGDSGARPRLRDARLKMQAVRHRNAAEFTAFLLAACRALPPSEAAYVRRHAGISAEELAEVEAELATRVARGISTDSEDGAGAEGAGSSWFNRATAINLRRGGSSEGASLGWTSHSSMQPGSAPGHSGVAGSVVSPARSSGRTAMRLDSMTAPSSIMSLPFGLDGGGSVDSLSLSSTSSRSTKSQASRAARSRGPKAGRSRWGGAADNGNSSENLSQSLRAELFQSLRNMQEHTVKVKDGITAMQQMVQVSNPRARAMLLSVAAERMEAAIWRLVKRELARGLTAWKLAVHQFKRRLHTVRVFRFLALRNLSEALWRGVASVINKKLVVWINFTQVEMARIRAAQRHAACVTIQRIMRGVLGRERVRHLRERIKYKAIYGAVLKIQAQIRGRVTKWRYQRYVLSVKRDKGSRVLQRVWRGRRARKRVRLIRIQRNKNKAATIIQALARGRRGRLRVRTVRHEKWRGRCATRIQALARGFLERKHMAAKALARKRRYAAILIQKRIRGVLGRMSMARRRKQMFEYREMRRKAVTSIQAAYRGYRSRLKSRMRMLEAQRKRRRLDNAATKIITMVRGFLCRAFVRDLRKKRFNELLADARAWQEMWSEDTEAFFYLNKASGDALWEPPARGYTKADGQLVLATGAIIDDPAVLEAEEEEKRKNSDKICCECTERTAIRACDECGDNFCTPCFRTSHAAGSRRKHTYTALGPLDCSECELVLAERWCVTCDEAFCDACWRKVHAHGKRRFHPFSEVSSKGRVDSRIITMDGTEIKDYDASYSQQQYEGEQEQYALGQAQIASDEAAALEGPSSMDLPF